MVTIVTHIRELADRMPVRLEVAKSPGGSTVTRVDV
jgi:DNA repair exonuclease SbcCD ATPase subunit